jgi:hypothetical protein
MVFTKAVSVAESFGKKVSLLVVPAGDVFAALVQGANNLEVDSVISSISSKMTAEDQAFHMGQAWEALPEPKRQFNFYVIDPGGEVKVFYIGPHAPALSPDDVQLVHRLWLNMRRDPSVSDLHHSDIITYSLTRLAGQYAREKQEICATIAPPTHRPPCVSAASRCQALPRTRLHPRKLPSLPRHRARASRKFVSEMSCHPEHLDSRRRVTAKMTAGRKHQARAGCHPERSLTRGRGPRRQVFVAGVVGRQTESKDLRLHFGTFDGNFRDRTL